MSYVNPDDFKLNYEQIEHLLDKLVPLIAEPKDYDFFRAIIRIKAEELNSSSFAYFVSKLLNS